MRKQAWSDTEISALILALNESETFEAAVRLHRKRSRKQRTPGSCRMLLKEKGLGGYARHLKSPARRKEDLPQDKQVERLSKILLSDRKGISLEDLCNKLNESPKTVRSLIDIARGTGKAIEVPKDDQIVLTRGVPEATTAELTRIPIEPIEDYYTFGSISDTHSGSTHARIECLRDAIAIAYHDFKVRRIFHSGDFSAGLSVYRGQTADLTAHTFETQLDAVDADLPKHPGLVYELIGGNHDENHLKVSGSDIVKHLGIRRPDINTHGYYSALIDLQVPRKKNALKVELRHWRGGMSYARSYKIQKSIEQIPPGMKPHFLLGGHFHVGIALPNYRGVCGLLSYCFEDQTALLKALGLSPEIGMWIVKVGIARDGSPRSINLQALTYFHSKRGPIRGTLEGEEIRLDRSLGGLNG